MTRWIFISLIVLTILGFISIPCMASDDSLLERIERVEIDSEKIGRAFANLEELIYNIAGWIAFPLLAVSFALAALNFFFGLFKKTISALTIIAIGFISFFVLANLRFVVGVIFGITGLIKSFFN